MAALLSVEDLKTYFYTKRGVVRAVDGVSFTVDEGETLGVVGESGCGKSITALSILRLVPQPAGKIVGGRIIFDGEDLLTKSEGEMRDIRGSKISMVLQDPLTSLNPVFSIGDQVAQPFRHHHQDDHLPLREKILDVLRRVRIPTPEVMVRSYPHQFSGGMRQRIVTAMALACRPRLIIADEPTTALDVTIQAQILKLLKETQRELGLAFILITHDLGIVARVCDRVAVMYAGKVVESARVEDIYERPMHPYTKALLNSVPQLGARKKRLNAIEGQPPSLTDLGPGCRFAPRCPERFDKCQTDMPVPISTGDGEYAACWLLDK
jgi:oligopeptide/dipeptide ABC transporter ATP-binding protein